MSEPKAEAKYVLLKMADRPAYLIGQIMEEGTSDVVLYYPVLISIYYDDDGMQVVTSKYLPFAEGDVVSIVKTSIHAIASPKQRLIQHYLEFVRKWKQDGMEKILEARMVGDAEPKVDEALTLTDEPPTEQDIKH